MLNARWMLLESVEKGRAKEKESASYVAIQIISSASVLKGKEKGGKEKEKAKDHME